MCCCHLRSWGFSICFFVDRCGPFFLVLPCRLIRPLVPTSSFGLSVFFTGNVRCTRRNTYMHVDLEVVGLYIHFMSFPRVSHGPFFLLFLSYLGAPCLGTHRAPARLPAVLLPRLALVPPSSRPPSAVVATAARSQPRSRGQEASPYSLLLIAVRRRPPLSAQRWKMTEGAVTIMVGAGTTCTVVAPKSGQARSGEAAFSALDWLRSQLLV